MATFGDGGVLPVAWVGKVAAGQMFLWYYLSVPVDYSGDDAVLSMGIFGEFAGTWQYPAKVSVFYALYDLGAGAAGLLSGRLYCRFSGERAAGQMADGSCLYSFVTVCPVPELYDAGLYAGYGL